MGAGFFVAKSLKCRLVHGLRFPQFPRFSLLKKAGGEEPSRKPRGPTATPKLAANGELDISSALEALKPLVKELGAEQAKRLIDLLG